LFQKVHTLIKSINQKIETIKYCHAGDLRKMSVIEKKDKGLSFEAEGIGQLKSYSDHQMSGFMDFCSIMKLFCLSIVEKFSLDTYFREQKKYTVLSRVNCTLSCGNW
jgi:hypothetical protein